MKNKFIIFFVLSLTTFAQPITLSWDDNSSDELGFRIERSINGGPFVEIAVVSTDVTSYTDDIQVGNKYTYRVCAYNEVGNSEYSNSIDVGTYEGVPINVKISFSNSK